MRSPDQVRPVTFGARSATLASAFALLISVAAGCGGSGSDACAVGSGDGTIWVAAQDVPGIMRIDAAHLTATGSGADLTITAMDAASFGTLSSPMGIAFDGAGNLWVNYDGTIESIPAAEQTGTGSKTITPPVVITTDVLTLPVGIAFDQDGGLWFAHEVNKFARFDATQLRTSGAVTPSIVITSDDVGSAAWFAMYPAPPFTPLYHKVP